MKITELTPQLLRHAATIKDKVALRNKELVRILGQLPNGIKPTGNRRMSAAGRRRIAAAQRARWARARKAKATTPSAKASVRKSKMSAAATARVSARMKKYWKARKAGSNYRPLASHRGK